MEDFTEFTYGCDGGSLSIGTASARVSVPNCYGDGEHKLLVINGKYDPCLHSGCEFRGAVEGNEIKVFKYDCFTDDECADEKNVLVTLSGRYGIYAKLNSGDMILEKWS